MPVFKYVLYLLRIWQLRLIIKNAGYCRFVKIKIFISYKLFLLPALTIKSRDINIFNKGRLDILLRYYYITIIYTKYIVRIYILGIGLFFLDFTAFIRYCAFAEI